MTEKKIDVSGKVALVTGSNRGIGKAITEELLNQGAAKVYAGARDVTSLAELQEKHGDKIVPVELDVTNDEQVTAAAKLATDVDILVNNAGVLVPGNFAGGNVVETLKKNLSVNLYGVAKVVTAFYDSIKTKDAAAIVNVASVVGLGNMSMASTYSVSKAAVHSLTQGLRAELQDTGVLVAGVYPGPIDTDMAKGFDMDKESPQNVAVKVVQGITDGVEDIFPDPMAEQVGAGYMQSPKAIEQQFANFSV